MKRSLDVVFTIDGNYIEHFSTALLSLLENNRDVCFRIFLIYEGNETLLEPVLIIFAEEYGADINVLTVSSDQFRDFRITHHIKTATYFRLSLADILPQDVEKALYLDCDLVVNGSVAELADIRMGGGYLRAVEHCFPCENKKHLKKFGIDPYSDYFNAGVMLINLKKWREDGLTGKLMAFAFDSRDDILWWDQDVLNIMLHGGWKRLPPKFNLIWEIMESESADPEIKEAQAGPAVIHYTRSVKPWHWNSWHAHRGLYWKYRKKYEELKMKYIPRPQEMSFEEAFSVFEPWRSELTASDETVEFTDYGAVAPDLNLSQEEMYVGRKVTKTRAELCRQGFKDEKLKNLFILIREFRPKVILELGTLCGMSSLYISEASRESFIHTIEGAPNVAEIAASTFGKFGLQGRVRQHVGRFQDVLPALLKEIGHADCVLIDGHHNGEATVSYYSLVRQYMKSGGLVIFDDIRWDRSMLSAWEQIITEDFDRVYDFGSFGAVVLK